MKFRQTATIAIYFSYSLLCMALFINASKHILIGNFEPRDVSPIPILTQNYLLDVRCSVSDVQFASGLEPVKTMRLLHFIDILSKIVNEFLTIREILILRQTCLAFEIFLFPNDENMVMFCKDFNSKEMDQDIPLTWFDLKHFLHHSYTNALDKMTLLNLKHNQYAVFTRDEKIISWDNEQASDLYNQMIVNKITNGNYQMPLGRYEPPRIYNKWGNAWAQITNEKNVITGGDKQSGGHLEPFEINKLNNVKMIKATSFAFAALLGNKNVIAWGNEFTGGKIPEQIQNQLKNVKTIFSNYYAFAALLEDGSVIAWGQHKFGGKISKPIQKAKLQNKCFCGKLSEPIYNQLQNVKTIFSSSEAFVALFHDGSVFSWGSKEAGGKIPEDIQIQLYKNIKMIFSNDYAFVALLKVPLNNNCFVAWGNEDFGGKITDKIQTRLENFSKGIFSSRHAFAVLLNDESVFIWGCARGGRKKITDKFGSVVVISNVKMILPQINGFTAVRNKGEMIPLGNN